MKTKHFFLHTGLCALLYVALTSCMLIPALPSDKDAALNRADAGECQQNCVGRQCGPDPDCGISCGECGEGSCNAEGMCVADACVPDCRNRSCGLDPTCNTSCGFCSVGVCDAQGQCTTLDQACDPISQAPCGSGEMCEVGDDLRGTCRTAGTAPAFASCEQQTCARGLICSRVTATAAPLCLPICNTASDYACPTAANSVCLWGFADSNIGACGIPCNLFADACPAGMYCSVILDEDNDLIGQCLPAPDSGFINAGDTCSQGDDRCPSGTLCIGESTSSSRCYPLCNEQHPCSTEQCLPIDVDGHTIESVGFCEQCFPDCSERSCGADPVCGISCGQCDANQMCQDDGQCCRADCNDRSCGVDPVCGVSCGTCNNGEICSDAGQCCRPDCQGRSCGLDPLCGSSCGTCSGSASCTADGQCLCEPQCGSRECGADPICGTSCGTCSGGDVCKSGSCCTPSCGERECGTESSCGTSCGSCYGEEYCSAGQCQGCTTLNDSCSNDSQCCQYTGQVECRYGSCQQCIRESYACSYDSECCSGLYCNPGGMCSRRDCSEQYQRCLYDSQCCDNMICDDDQDVCRPCGDMYGSCSRNSDCCDGLTCTDNLCQYQY